MKPDDDQLRKLLRRWPDLEPRANFEADVWRRIRSAPSRAPVVGGFGALLELWWPQRSWALAAVVLVSAILGSFVGVHTAPRPGTGADRELEFLSPATLAGGYVKLAGNPAAAPGDQP